MVDDKANIEVMPDGGYRASIRINETLRRDMANTIIQDACKGLSEVITQKLLDDLNNDADFMKKLKTAVEINVMKTQVDLKIKESDKK